MLVSSAFTKHLPILENCEETINHFDFLNLESHLRLALHNKFDWKVARRWHGKVVGLEGPQGHLRVNLCAEI